MLFIKKWEEEKELDSFNLNMNNLKIKFVGNANNSMLQIQKYVVSESLKEKFIGEKGNNVQFIRMKITNVNLSYVSNSFDVKYTRYLSFESASNKSNIDNVVNTKTGNFPTKGEIIFKINYLCTINLNFVNLSYGNELDFGQLEYNLPVEFVLGKDTVEKYFKFFLEYHDGSAITTQDEMTIDFQLVE